MSLVRHPLLPHRPHWRVSTRFFTRLLWYQVIVFTSNLRKWFVTALVSWFLGAAAAFRRAFRRSSWFLQTVQWQLIIRLGSLWLIQELIHQLAWSPINTRTWVASQILGVLWSRLGHDSYGRLHLLRFLWNNSDWPLFIQRG